MSTAKKRFDYVRGEKIFQKTFEQLSALPNGIIRNRNTTPANLFEGVSVGAALVIKAGKELILTNAEEWMASDELRNYTTGATNSKKNVASRIDFCSIVWSD